MLEEYIRSLILRLFNYLYSIFNISMCFTSVSANTRQEETTKKDFINRYFS